MEHSIDLRYLMQVSFGDRQLLHEIMEEWVSDMRDRIVLLRDREGMMDPGAAFTRIHNLKTSFFMVGHQPMIRLCDKFLRDHLQDADMLAQAAEEAVSFVAETYPASQQEG